MEILIKLDKRLYKYAKHHTLTSSEIDEICDVIANGILLPEGHGRLIDENELIDEIVCEEIDGRYYDVIYAHSIYDANTIIEADKEIEEE